MSGRIAAADDRRRRADYLAEITTLLYPDQLGDGDPVEYIAVPNADRPRILAPAASRSLAVAALRRYARPASALARRKRDAAVAALLGRMDKVLLPHRITLQSGPNSIDAYLRDALGRDVHLCIHIGPARANRKPVLQLIDAKARTVGFAKLGVNTLTESLVQAETHALRRMSKVPLQRLRVPEVVHSGRWRGHSVLVQEALPGWVRPRRHDPARLTRAMQELAVGEGVDHLALGDSDYAAQLRQRLRALGERSDREAVSLVEAGLGLLHSHRRQRMQFGAWHGDWTPWNCAELSGGILLWDFERYRTGVPLGFDAVHHTLQRDIVTRRVEPAAAVDMLLSQAPLLLAPFDIAPQAATVSVQLYLVDLAARYLADRQAEAGAALGALGSWLLPTLLRHITAEEKHRETAF